MATRRHSAKRREAGFTIIEMMVVLAILGLLLVAMSATGLIKTQNDRLREDTLEVMATLRAAFNFSTQTGTHHRVVFDLDQQAYRIEICEGPIALEKTETEEVPDQEAIAELLERPPTSEFDREILEAASPEEATAAAAALAGVKIGTARCTLSEASSGHVDGKGNQRRVDRDHGIHIDEITVEHLSEPAESGLASINFFPLGRAEKAVVHLESEEGDSFWILVHGLTGRVELKKGDFDPDDHMRVDGAGDDIDEEDER